MLTWIMDMAWLLVKAAKRWAKGTLKWTNSISWGMIRDVDCTFSLIRQISLATRLHMLLHEYIAAYSI